MKLKKVSEVRIGKHKTTFGYDKRGNLINARNTNGQRVSIKYDKKGRIATIKDQAKRLVHINYESRFGKPSKIARPGVGTIQKVNLPGRTIFKKVFLAQPLPDLSAVGSMCRMRDRRGHSRTNAKRAQIDHGNLKTLLRPSLDH